MFLCIHESPSASGGRCRAPLNPNPSNTAGTQALPVRLPGTEAISSRERIRNHEPYVVPAALKPRSGIACNSVVPQKCEARHPDRRSGAAQNRRACCCWRPRRSCNLRANTIAGKPSQRASTSHAPPLHPCHCGDTSSQLSVNHSRHGASRPWHK